MDHSPGFKRIFFSIKKFGCSPFWVGGHHIGYSDLKSDLRGLRVSAKGFSNQGTGYRLPVPISPDTHLVYDGLDPRYPFGSFKDGFKGFLRPEAPAQGYYP